MYADNNRKLWLTSYALTQPYIVCTSSLAIIAFETWKQCSHDKILFVCDSLWMCTSHISKTPVVHCNTVLQVYCGTHHNLLRDTINITPFLTRTSLYTFYMHVILRSMHGEWVLLHRANFEYSKVSYFDTIPHAHARANKKNILFKIKSILRYLITYPVS